MKNSINVSIDGKTFDLYNTTSLILISGPCVVENSNLTFNIAKKIKEISQKLEIPFIFKASYKKAIRSSGISFRQRPNRRNCRRRP